MSEMKIKLKPFNMPNFVIPILPVGERQDGIKFADGISLSEVPKDVLEIMCHEFRDEIMRKAGHKP